MGAYSFIPSIDYERILVYIMTMEEVKRPNPNKPGRRRKRMEQDEMTQAELILLLETLAENIEAKATTAAEAAAIIRSKVESLK